MVWRDGEFIKDLNYLNRDLRKVVALESHPKNIKNQPKNAIIISEFEGD
jgi:import inner membrane translocase subunit TIM50